MTNAMRWLGGAVCGATVAALACWEMYGAPLNQPMATSEDGWGENGVRYIVQKKRFDWFYPSHGPVGYHSNCWGGHTLDGRCISLVSVSGGAYLVPAKPQPAAVDADCASKINDVTAAWQHAYGVWQSVYFVHFDKQMRDIDRMNARTQAILDHMSVPQDRAHD